MQPNIISKPIRFKDGDGFLHGFSTGTVSLKTKYLDAQGGQLISKINFLLDQEWTAYMPIMVWVIDHPEGVFVVDTGENARVTEPDYFKQEGRLTNYINTRSFRFDIKPEDEIGPQLARLGYSQQDIRQVILTHLHLDHFDGLAYFDQTEVLVHQLEWQKPSFALPSLYPEWFVPAQVAMNASPDSVFTGSTPLTTSGELMLVHTPGHTLGHSSVLVQTEDCHYLLAGDVTYTQTQLLQETHSAGHQSFTLSRETYARVKQYAKKNPLVYLPSHDPESVMRVEKDAVLAL